MFYAISGGQFWLVANSVHTADANRIKLKISNMFSFKIFSRRQFWVVANCVHTTDANPTQQNSSVGSESVVWNGFNEDTKSE